LGSNPWADEASDDFQADLAEEALGMLQVEVSRKGNNGTKSLDKVKEKMQKLYPERFNTRRRATSSVDSTDTSTSTKSGGSRYSRKLDAEQRRIGERFVELGTHKSLEEYAKELNDIGELK
jgi:Txe/YoeB family toxin of Txe-Axe toxin-antitoxin module